jgi:hypothetical protein
MTAAFLSLDAHALDAADAEALRCIEITHELDHPIGRAVATGVRIWVAIERGEHTRARQLLDGVAGVAQGSGYVMLLGQCVAAGVALACEDGELERAAVLLGGLEANPDALGGEGAAAISGRVDALRERLERDLGAETFARSVARGGPIPLADHSF